MDIEVRDKDDGQSLFVKSPESSCKEHWSLWPKVQERGLEQNNVIVFSIFSSVGNLFIVLHRLIPVRGGELTLGRVLETRDSRQGQHVSSQSILEQKTNIVACHYA